MCHIIVSTKWNMCRNGGNSILREPPRISPGSNLPDVMLTVSYTYDHVTQGAVLPCAGRSLDEGCSPLVMSCPPSLGLGQGHRVIT